MTALNDFLSPRRLCCPASLAPQEGHHNTARLRHDAASLLCLLWSRAGEGRQKEAGPVDSTHVIVYLVVHLDM